MHTTTSTIKNIIDAAENNRPVLLDRISSLEKGFYLNDLLTTFNKLIDENNKFSAAGQGYLEQIDTTLAKLREAVVIVDHRHQIKLANDAFKSLVNVDKSPIDDRLDQYIHGTDFLECLQEIKRGTSFHRREIEASIGTDTIWLELSATAITPKSKSKTVMTLFVLHNISRQKQLELMRTDFVANVSHELKTPVTIIKGFADTLLEDDDILDPVQRKRFIGKIQTNSERLDRLIQDLLLISRLECTEIELQKELVSIREIIKEFGDALENRFLNPEQKVVYFLDPVDDFVSVDILRIHQVLNNLTDNVLHHAKNFTTLTYSTKVEANHVWISVSDDGPGIPEKDLPHIFERFYRVEKGRSREKGGTGLGMSIVKHIVQSHGGILKAESWVGKGTTVSFSIPKTSS